MGKIYGVLLRFFGLKYMVRGYQGLEGYKSQIGMVAGGCVFAAQAFGKIDKETAEKLYAGIAVWTGKSFIDKLNRYQDEAKDVAGAVRDAAVKTSGDVAQPQKTQGSGEGASQ